MWERKKLAGVAGGRVESKRGKTKRRNGSQSQWLGWLAGYSVGVVDLASRQLVFFSSSRSGNREGRGFYVGGGGEAVLHPSGRAGRPKGPGPVGGCHQTAFKDLQFSAPPCHCLELERERERAGETPARARQLFSDGKRWGRNGKFGE